MPKSVKHSVWYQPYYFQWIIVRSFTSLCCCSCSEHGMSLLAVVVDSTSSDHHLDRCGMDRSRHHRQRDLCRLTEKVSISVQRKKETFLGIKVIYQNNWHFSGQLKMCLGKFGNFWKYVWPPLLPVELGSIWGFSVGYSHLARGIT